MPAIAYPADLPGPLPGSMNPRPRRAASAIEGPLLQRARQRDFAGALSRYAFIYTPAQMATWLEWFRDVLLQGRRWFAIALPGAGGLVNRVARYRDVQQEHLASGIYRVNATFEQRGASVEPELEVDTADVILMLHGDGVDGGTDIFDSSAYHRDPVAEGAGALKISTTRSKWGGSSLYNAATDHLRYAPEDFQWGSQDFTIEAWVYSLISDATLRCLISYGDNGGTGVAFAFESSTGIGARFSVGTGAVRYDCTVAGGLPTNQWINVALVRDGNTIRQYWDGVQMASAGCAGSLYVPTIYPHVNVARRYDGAENWPCYIDDLRVTRGLCRYPGGTTFAVPAGPYLP